MSPASTSVAFVVELATAWVLADHLAHLRAVLVRDRQARVGLARTAALAALAVALRLVLVPPSFTHDNFHAGTLVDTMLGYVGDSNPRVRSYGPVGFVLLHDVASLAGRSFETIVRMNVVISVLTLVAFGHAFARATGRPAVRDLTVLLGALYPPLARVAASEDLHALAGFFAASAWLALDRAARVRGARAPLVAVAAAGLMLFTRQTFFGFAPCLVLLVVGAHGLAVLRRPEVLGASVGVALLGGLRVVSSLGDSSDHGTLVAMAATYRQPTVWLTILRGHVALDPTRGGLALLPCAHAGLFALPAGRLRGSIMALVGFQFALTASFFRSNPGAELCMRTPLLLPLVACAAVGAEALVTRCGGRSRPWCAAALGLLALAAPLATPGARAELAAQSVEYQEARYVESVAPSLPPRFALVSPARASWSSPAELPEFVFARAGRAVVRVEVDAPRPVGIPALAFEGLGCWSWSMQELMGLTAWDRDHFATSPRAPRFAAAVLAQALPPDVSVPTTRRPACDSLLASGAPLPLPAGHLVPHTVVPFIHFGGPGPYPLRFHRLADPPGSP